MQICRELAGYSFAHADLVRRAMAKKKADVMQAEREAFLSGTAERGIAAPVANGIFDEMVSFASYAFNKCHAAPYALLSYRTAYLKTHHKREYMAALMTSVLGDAGKLGEYISECKHAGIEVLAPDINESALNFTVAGKHIRFGLLAIKNVGRNFVTDLLAERKKGEFKSFEDFASRMAGSDLNRRQVEALIKCGAFDRLGVWRSRLLAAYEQILDGANARARSNLTGQLDLFAELDVQTPTASFDYPDLPDFNLREKLILEKESAGMSFSGHLLDEYANHIEVLACTPIAEILSSYSEETGESDRFADKQKLRVAGLISRRINKNTRNGDAMAFVTLEDRYGEMELVVFPKLLDRFGAELFIENAVCAEGELSLREGEAPKLLLSSLSLLKSNATYEGEQASPPKAQKLYLKLRSLSSSECEEALRLCRLAKGDTPLILFDGENRRYVAAKGVSVTVVDALLSALRTLLGDENVVLR